MKKQLTILATAAILLSGTQTASAATSIFEDFSSTLSLQKYYRTQRSLTIDNANENAKFSMQSKAYTKHGKSFYFVLDNKNASMLQADINVSNVTLGNSDTQQAMMRVAGTFYNANSANPSSDLGEVFVTIALGDRGNGPEAWYEIQTSLAETFDDTQLDQTFGTLGTIVTGTSYPVSLTYDGDHTFTFVFNNGTAVVVDGPVRMGAAYKPFKAIGGRLRFGQDNSTVDLSDELADDGSLSSLSGTFDNVTTEDGLLDDFSTGNFIDSAWDNDQRSAEVVDGQLKLMALGQGSQSTVRLHLRHRNINAFGAKLTLKSESTNNASMRPHVKLTHFLGNDTFDIENGVTGDGYKGNIWAQFGLERKNGTLRAVVSAHKILDADWKTSTEFFFRNLGSINIDQQYSLLIDVTGTLVEYKLDGSTVASFNLASDFTDDLTGNVYPISKGTSGVQARVRDGVGEVHALIDDIVTDITPVVVTLNTNNSDGDAAVLPSEVVVHEDETVTLSASVSEASSVAAYVWEQTAGTDVNVITSSRSSFAQKLVGSNSTFSFTVPSGTDQQTLAFKVTVIENSGAEIEQTFDISVDQSATQTLATLEATNSNNSGSGSSSSNSSGGGAFNPLFLLLGFLWVFSLRRVTKNKK